ncbi:hypothetical protein [Thermococcus stetteri]|uniref:hypothetical protein n=1 Tax=Thermococcus stetteri TaxID=49900 RepID=UPI001AE5511A|nr:hypothetical protein [Thermococcus stetteri]MBP1911867.1 vacuolar-type H+-ATPase subunit I/STV1 [Thermococcus stetteri]
MEENLDDIALKVAADLGVTTPDEKEMIKEYIRSAVKVGRAIATAIHARKPKNPESTARTVNAAIEIEKEHLLKLYNIRRRIGIEKNQEDPHKAYPEHIREQIQRIIDAEMEEKRRIEEEKRMKAKKRVIEKLEEAKDLLPERAKNILKKLAEETPPDIWAEVFSERDDLARATIEHIEALYRDKKDPQTIVEKLMKEYNVPPEVLAKIRPDLMKAYIDMVERANKRLSPQEIAEDLMGKHRNVSPGVLVRLRPDLIRAYIENMDVDPKELIAKEKDEELREELMEFLEQHGFAKEIEEIKKVEEEVKKVEEAGENITFEDARVDVLSIISGLEFAGFSEEAKERAVEILSSRIASLVENEPTPENLQVVGLYAYVLELIKRGEFERVKGIKNLIPNRPDRAKAL